MEEVEAVSHDRGRTRPRRPSISCCTSFDERLCWNAELLMQSPDHFQGERAVTTADEKNEIARLKPILIHMILAATASARLEYSQASEMPIYSIELGSFCSFATAARSASLCRPSALSGPPCHAFIRTISSKRKGASQTGRRLRRP